MPSLDGTNQHFAVGFDDMHRRLNGWFKAVDQDGGVGIVIKGSYGQGKTFALRLIEEYGLSNGFVTVRTEVDNENRLTKPHLIYRDLMSNLRVPEYTQKGVSSLATLIIRLLDNSSTQRFHDRQDWLEARIGCRPLSWLLSDPGLMNKPTLLNLWNCDPSVSSPRGRAAHVWTPPPHFWPAFSAATQGDFASFLLSGLGRLARVLGFKGLLIIMDEMERWQDLNWAEQSKAGNLLGGLIWGATARQGSRTDKFIPKALTHSGRCGGYPFTTEGRNHVGIAIAMTPRGEYGPEYDWQNYGPLDFHELPTITEKRITEYCQRVAERYSEAYGLAAPSAAVVEILARRAILLWREDSSMTTRTAVQAAIAAFDHWRDALNLALTTKS